MRAAVVVVVVVAVMVGLLWGFQRQLIYLPFTGPVPAAGEVMETAEDVTLETADGLELGAWYVPADGAPTVLVAAGNAGNRELRAPLGEALAAEGLGVLLFDYRGFGDNPGNPTEEGLALDIRAAQTFLVEQAGVSEGQLVYYGESLGAAVVAELAVERPPAALVLRSPFTDLASIGRRHYPFLPVRTLLRDRYPAAAHLAEIDVPTTVVLGTDDGIVPPSESRQAAAVAAGPVQLVEIEGAGHNDRALLDGAELIEAIVTTASAAADEP